jgi:polyphosphate kinase 2 (PPK2 family)
LSSAWRGSPAEPEWRRAYRELNEFERELAEHGVIVLKFWLHIGKEEQLKRFRDREATTLQEAQDGRRGLAQPQEMGLL